ncbi:MAG: TetR family transcriptional regulator [Ignavibacteria bacterium]|nr:TetR family transcriptional regulator [Ignavibacteria bacterium]
MKRTKEDAEITKQDLLEAAFKEFLENGFQKTKLEDIAIRAEVTRGALYWHFKNKEDLLESLIEWKDLESIAITNDVLGSSAKPLTKLQKLISLNFGEFKNKKQEQNFVRLKAELYKHYNEKGDKNKLTEKFMLACKKLIEDCQKDGSIKKNVNSEDAAVTILFLCAGSYIRFNAVPANLRSTLYTKKLTLNYLKLISI